MPQKVTCAREPAGGVWTPLSTFSPILVLVFREGGGPSSNFSIGKQPSRGQLTGKGEKTKGARSLGTNSLSPPSPEHRRRIGASANLRSLPNFGMACRTSPWALAAAGGDFQVSIVTHSKIVGNFSASLATCSREAIQLFSDFRKWGLTIF